MTVSFVRTCLLLGSSLGICVGAAACGAEPAPAKPPPAPTAAPVAAPEPEAEPPAGSAAGGEGGSAPSESPPPPPDKPKSSGRPAILMGPSEKISSTFGATPGAVLKLKAKGTNEPFVLKIPEFSLRTGYNITLEPAKNVKGKDVVGPVYQLLVTEQEKTKPIVVESGGEPFEFRVPTFGKDSVNLAYGAIVVEAGKQTVKWTVHAPRNVDTSFGVAYVYLPKLGHGYLHATTQAPTTAEGEPSE